MTTAAASRGKSEPLNRNEMRAMRRYALDYLRPSQQRFLAPRSLVVLRFAVCSRKSLPTDAPDGPDFPPPPPPLLFCHDWIPGVALRGTLAQTDRPYGGSLAFGAALRLGLPSHTPSRERPRLGNASLDLVQLPLASGCLQQTP